MNQHFIVSYEIDYVHRVSVGIIAASQKQALELAEQAFNQGVIWDDTQSMPLLSDDFHESGDETLVWECEAVDNFPAPDHAVLQLKKQAAALQVCRGLVERHQQQETSGHALTWDDLNDLLTMALTVYTTP